MKIKQIKNFKMNNEVYQLRRKVMELIYEVKKEIKNLPRIEVRIGEASCQSHLGLLGVAKLKQCQVWITKKAIDFGTDHLRNTVYHELVHAVAGFGHDEKCPLMESKANHTLNKQQCMEALMKYIK